MAKTVAGFGPVDTLVANGWVALSGEPWSEMGSNAAMDSGSEPLYL